MRGALFHARLMTDDNEHKLPSFAHMVRSEFEAEREKAYAERLAILEDRHASEKPSWFAKWMEPGPIIAIAGLIGVGFTTFNNVQSSITEVRMLSSTRAAAADAQFATLQAELKSNADDDQRRTQKYGPIVEANKASIDMQKIVNDNVSDRINSLVKSVQDLRDSIGQLRDMEQKTREEMAVERAMRERK